MPGKTCGDINIYIYIYINGSGVAAAGLNAINCSIDNSNACYHETTDFSTS